jgi:penicillin-binding protein 1A
MRLMMRFFGWLFAVGTVAFVIGIGILAYLIQTITKELPNHEELRNYQPKVMSRMHAADGQLIGEYAEQRRLYMPIAAVPKRIVQAFIASEDKNFYNHTGIDFQGVARATLSNIQAIGSGRRPQGASTITQQVAKNFLLTSEQSYDRKIKEALISMRIEGAFKKDEILELYLNEIYLGFSAYGVAAASLLYFDKSVHELTIAEAAYLAALPKAPTQLHPFRNRDRAIERRNYVIGRMLDDKYITQKEHDEARKSPLTVVPRAGGTQIFAAEYFAEEVRREIVERYGVDRLYKGGLSIRTTLDPKLQAAAKKSLGDALVKFDERRGYRGAISKMDDVRGDWAKALGDTKALSDVNWRIAVVLDVPGDQARIGLQPAKDASKADGQTRETGFISAEGVRWTGKAVRSVLTPGDVIHVEQLADKPGQYRLRQVPEVQGGIIAMDAVTGRIRAMVGGFSFDHSQFNRASQALRQPGSAFKPFVYAAALDNGYTPSTVIVDAPFELMQANGEMWRPLNYSGKFYGPQTLRFGIEVSRNVMTVRLSNDLGMPLIVEYSKRFGIYDDLLPVLSMALGAGETTLLRMTTAYAIMANGGKRVKSTLIDRIQDRNGQTLYKHDERICQGCNAEKWTRQDEPSLIDKREQVIDPMTAYQMTSIMEGVIQRGTAQVIKALGKPIAGKTGTSNDEKDAWFIGYSPELVTGVYIGYDKPKAMGEGSTGGVLAAPVFLDFMKTALAGKPPVPFAPPAGIKLIRVDAKSGVRSGSGGILEAFKPGTAPPEAAPKVQPLAQDGGADPDASRAIRSGTGGLY